MLGPILGRCKRAVFTYPGGCDIGMRPIDLHLKGLRAIGAHIHEEGGLIYCDGRQMRGAAVHLDYPSVGATENIMLAAVLTPGETIIHNAACEPEITDLQEFVNAMGGNVRGAGTSTVWIQGVSRLNAVTHNVIADRIVAGTYMAAAGVTGGDVLIRGIEIEHVGAICAKMQEMGCLFHHQRNQNTLRVTGPKKLDAFHMVQTQPYPGFPTDMQAQMMAMATIAEGTSVIVENIFENRFNHAAELLKMGANINIRDRTAVVRGVSGINGATVLAHDLRGGAALVLAALAAKGQSYVQGVHSICRGYDRLDQVLQSLGAQITLIE